MKAWPRLSGCLLLLAGCRQPNPEWKGPEGVDDGSGTTTELESDTGSSTAPASDSSGSPPATTGQDCNNDNQCPEGWLCGPMGCQQGGDGDPCNGDGDCRAPTPICGQQGTCQDGSDGDPCSGDGDCTSPSPFCGPQSTCQDGSDGDPCSGNGDCQAPTPICGQQSTCQDGSAGDPCSGDSDCAGGLSCTSSVCG